VFLYETTYTSQELAEISLCIIRFILSEANSSQLEFALLASLRFASLRLKFHRLQVRSSEHEKLWFASSSLERTRKKIVRFKFARVNTKNFNRLQVDSSELVFFAFARANLKPSKFFSEVKWSEPTRLHWLRPLKFCVESDRFGVTSVKQKP